MSLTLPLPTLFANALASASKASNLPTTDDATQDLIQSTLLDLATLNDRIAALSLFSPNEQLEDISTTDLIYLIVPYVYAEVQGRVRTTGRDERLLVLGHLRRHLHRFLSQLENFGMIPEVEHSLQERRASSVSDPVLRRDLKIKQYKKEKELRARIEVVQKRRRQVPTSECHTDFDLISLLLPPNPQCSFNNEDDSDTEENIREATLLLLRLTFAQTHSRLENVNQELELLRVAPTPPPQCPIDDRRGKGKESEDMWRLDPPVYGSSDGKELLLDENGKPLRTFTLLPSGASDRARLQAKVFGPGHNLPTMSIDEYLGIERRRGTIIVDGGKQSVEKSTTSEQLALDAEMEGTALGEEKAEEKRLKDEHWARYTDEHPRGQGNTMNRG